MAPTLSSLPRRTRTRGANPVTQRTEPRWGGNWLMGRSGRTFESSQARTIPAVGRAINIIAGQIASYPLHQFEESPTGEPRRIRPEETRFLWGLPNPEMLSAFVFWRIIVAHKVLRENAYIFVVKDNGGRPLELWPINPTRVRVGRLDDGRKIYEVDGKEAMLDYMVGGEIVHILGDSEDGLVGIGPLERYGSAFELSLSSEEFASGTFQDGTPAGIIKVTDPGIDRTRTEELLDMWMARSAVRPRRPAVLTEGMDWEAVQFNPEESQMMESRRFSIDEIARIFGVPPHLLGEVEKSTTFGTGLEEIALQFRTFTLNDHMIPLEEALTTAFLPPTQWMRFNPDAVLRPDTLKRYRAHQLAVGGPWKAKNEARKQEGYPPVDGGDEINPPPNASIKSEPDSDEGGAA